MRRITWMALASMIILAGCSGVRLSMDTGQMEPSWASPPAESGILADMAGHYSGEHGTDHSGFKLLDKSHDALYWRLALIESAAVSLDIQTYLWYPDNSGRLILLRAIEAADRGVRVRLILDDLVTIGLDQLLYEMANHPNIEFRLFNPWEKRSGLARAGEMIASLERLNTRMHDKLLIADGRAAVVGGRNIGDHYFGLSEAYNFHDLDVLGFGQIASQASGMFDSFWNSEWVVPTDQLELEQDPEFARQTMQNLRQAVLTEPALESFPRQPIDWTEQLAELQGELHPGTSQLIYDEAGFEEIDQVVASRLFGLLGLASKELLITNAYIIPGQPGIDFIEELTGRGVKVRILTNSLASHDVPAVNSHYKGWRDDLIRAGAELYELRADPEIKSLVDVTPIDSGFTGLHTKAFVVDREMVFIGSMNFDPRSLNINTEAGAFITSKGLAEATARVMERDMQAENAWRVLLDDDGSLYWVNSDERVDRQPARTGSQRVMDAIFRMFPKEQF